MLEKISLIANVYYSEINRIVSFLIKNSDNSGVLDMLKRQIYICLKIRYIVYDVFSDFC